jgi:hypothetical protein
MNTWHGAVVLLMGLLMLGCRTDPRITALENELRLQEDRIYELQDSLKTAQESLEASQQDGEASRKDEGESDAASERISPRALAPPEPPAKLAPAERKPAKTTTPSGSPKTEELPELQIEMPAPGDFKTDVPETLKSTPAPGELPLPKLRDAPKAIPNPSRGKDAPGEAPPFQPGANKGAGPALPRADAGSIDPASARVQKITLDELLTGAFDVDGRPGDDGLSVVVQPLDDNGRRAVAAGPISVVVIDPAISGEAARVARWDFTAEETAAMYRKSGSAEGFHLELRWPDQTAIRHDELRLFVRYTTADGRKLHAEKPIEVALAGGPPPRDATARSTPAWRRKEVIEPQPQTPDFSSSRLESPAPPPPPSDAPVAQSSRRPTWSPERR